MENFLLDNSVITTMLGHAQNMATLNHINLNFSKESVEELDQVLELMHAEYSAEAEDEHDEEGLSGICLSFGIYIGECFRKQFGEQSLLWWYGIPAAAGDPTPFLKMDENEIYPVDWVWKQIVNGSKDSVQKKFRKYYKILARMA